MAKKMTVTTPMEEDDVQKMEQNNTNLIEGTEKIEEQNEEKSSENITDQTDSEKAEASSSKEEENAEKKKKIDEQENKNDDDENVEMNDEEEEKKDEEVGEKEEETDPEPRTSFRISEQCTLFLRRGDITEWAVDGETDSIVNAANETLLGGGGVDGAIHMAAGRELGEACRRIPQVAPGVRCPVGTARLTRGFNLPAAHVIHTVGPVYFSENEPARLLEDCYRNSIILAKENNIEYIAFPAISCGIYGYPYEEAAKVSLNTIRDAAKDLKEVHFVLFEKQAWVTWLITANNLFAQH